MVNKKSGVFTAAGNFYTLFDREQELIERGFRDKKREF